MSVKAVVGACWGDEGKGKTVDYLTEKADIVVRFQGGNNAGHTIINEYGKFALHLLPSGVFHKNVINVLGTGVAINIPELLKERDNLLSRGVPEPKLAISERAQIVLPYHKQFDEYEEERLKDRKFGSTKSGIAPFYADKYLKIGIQVADLFDKDVLREKLQRAAEIKNVSLEHLYHKPLLDVEALVNECYEYGQKIKPFVCNTTELLHTAIKEGKNILLEGQLGALKDVEHGICPYTTSSSTLAGYAPVGAGIPAHEIKDVVTVVKAYSSCVGEGPFVDEIFGEEGDELRRRGGDAGEFGATTGRPRRMGWFDMVATRYGCMLQGATEVALTVLDVLGYLDEIPVCVAYEIDGKQTDVFPITSKLYNAKPVYKKLPGWKCDISHIREFDKLPVEAKNYIKFIEDGIGTPITTVSVGPKREQTITR